MASETLTDYERRRLENIRRNSEMMASLMLQRKASDLSALSSSTKRPRPHPRGLKSPKPDPDGKKAKVTPRSPIVLRRSLRTRGIAPSGDGGSDQFLQSDSPQSPPSPVPARKRGPLLIRDAFVEGPASSDRHLLDEIVAAAYAKPRSDVEGKSKNYGSRFDPRSSLVLRPENVAKVVSERILSVAFFPFVDRTVIVAGNKLGHVGIWNVCSQVGDGVYLYTPHSAPVSGISIHPFSATKVYTSSYDGFVRLMDVEKETFNVIYSGDDLVFSVCQWPHDISSLYMGVGAGELKVWDDRAGNASSTWALHDDRINTINFNPQDVNLMATSSTDGTACIWDLRKMKKNQPESIKTVNHLRAVHSAYFSPSGNAVATTSIDNRVGVLSGANFDDLYMIRHYNQTGRWLSSFRAIWGWDDSYLFMGNVKRAVDVISITEKVMAPLESTHMTSIPCRFAAHPFQEGSLAGAAAGGKVYLWAKS